MSDKAVDHDNAAHIARVVDEAPPISREVLDRIAAIIVAAERQRDKKR